MKFPASNVRNRARRGGLREFRGTTHSPDSRFAIRRSPLSGFTLIEILVVMVILAVVAAVATLAVAGAGGERQLERDGERLGALLRFACEQAERSGRTIGLSLSRGGYRFSQAGHDAWLPFGDGELRTRRWSGQPQAQLVRDGEPVAIGAEFPDKPQVVCFSSGELTPFRLDLALADAPSRFRIQAGANADVSAAMVADRAP